MKERNRRLERRSKKSRQGGLPLPDRSDEWRELPKIRRVSIRGGRGIEQTKKKGIRGIGRLHEREGQFGGSNLALDGGSSFHL